ncbi:MAG: DUF1501 domain-containing protein [Planctomycetaceae bacterium]|jgi:hypothetical protein|nr:DUF1501 domain-containing protein [Planctomycetaceae bacterium]MBT6155536.1 DUF1501 domain-containing protein [Planctomycetaceae bacterium]MBT6485066.1 DUF1501 domain-containing protein [Planctomycetaceae bacterium]MBT6496968.1 DUF1501 domain-containing protein [Planctomycetaceae bacterium]
MKCDYACLSGEHEIGRRQFLGGLAGGVGAVAGGLGMMASPAAAKQLSKDQKRVVVIYMSGGLSQLESWDPKPKTKTGGPFRAIPTSVPGVHISELLPLTAQHMDKLSIVRGINTKNGDHGKGSYQMQYGRDKRPGIQLPNLGAVCAKALESPTNPLPGHIRIPGGGRGNDAAYLGPRYASIGINGKPPANSARVTSLTEGADQARNAFRRKANSRFDRQRRTAQTDAYTYSYEQAQELMKQRDVFDVSKEPAADHERYGKHDFGKHCLMARRLLENGITFVQLSHSNYDTHNENFNFHLEQLGEFDRSYAALVSDLHDRGMLDSTLIIVMSEFGRTPNINKYYGRDHWGTAWSVCLAGGKLQRGAVVGKTNAGGTAVIEDEVDHGHLFHTYLSAVGLDSSDTFDIGGRPIPLADPRRAPISKILS